MSLVATLLFLAACAPADDSRQVHWQRNLADARAIAAVEGRPILLAVNMDGESASERIVRENYQDPAFVRTTRSFVCVVSSVFRHTPRDHDDEGRRIACPRLGEVTCGEHVALEPAIYDAFLGGERIAPRHALIEADGTKRFDLFLLFDLGELDGALADAAEGAPPPVLERLAPAGDLDVLAGAHEHHARLAFEAEILAAPEAATGATLDLIRAHGNAGSIEALRILLPRAGRAPDELASRWTRTVEELELAAPAATVVRERLQSLGRFPGAPGLADDARLLALQMALAGGPDASGASGATRSLVLGYFVAGDAADRRAARRALESELASAEITEIERALAHEGSALDLTALLTADAPAPIAPTPKKILRPAAELEREMEDLDRAISEQREDAGLHARYGRAALELAQVRMETGGSGAQLLLEDAERWLATASKARPGDVDLLLERARTAFLLGRFDEQEARGLEALARASSESASDPLRFQLPGESAAELARRRDAQRAAAEAQRIEARRWIGDAAGRLLGTRSGGDPAVEAAGIARATRHLALVATSALADETDWQSLVSVFGALGMRREELACAQGGALRLPGSAVLRQALNDALWLGGRIDLAPAKAEWISAAHPGDAAAVWFAGYAHVLAAEHWRRKEDPERAIDTYRAADARFAASVALDPSYADGAAHYRALAALGRGFAHLLADRRQEAADALVAAISIRPAIADARDGLEREAVDLLDGALEWRRSGPSPVAPLALLAALEEADPDNAAWARRIADSELREALRADGRGERSLSVASGGAGTTTAPVPTAEGDACMELSVQAARRALAHEDTPENRRALAQSLTVFAERRLLRSESDDLDQARGLLTEAAPLLAKEALREDAGLETLTALAAELRAELGEARPVFRPGR